MALAAAKSRLAANQRDVDMVRSRDPLKDQRAEPSSRGQGVAELFRQFAMRPQDTTAILADLDPQKYAGTDVIADLESLLSQYLHWIVVGRFEVRLPQQKAALQRVARDAQKLALLLDGLDPDTAFLLQLSAFPSAMPDVSLPERIGAVSIELQRMANAATLQLRQPRFHKRGPSPRQPVQWILEELMRRFSSWSSHTVRFATRAELADTGYETRATVAASPATRFIETVFKALNCGSVSTDIPGTRMPVTTYVKSFGGDADLLLAKHVMNRIDAKRVNKRRGKSDT